MANWETVHTMFIRVLREVITVIMSAGSAYRNINFGLSSAQLLIFWKMRSIRFVSFSAHWGGGKGERETEGGGRRE